MELLRTPIFRGTISAIGIAVVASACGDARDSGDDASADAGNTALETGVVDGGSSSSGASGASDKGDEGGDDARLDVMLSDFAGDEGDVQGGCKKVDFLFVIDNSESMTDNQSNLIASFPGFINEIRTRLVDARDYHLMVVDTDSIIGQAKCAFQCEAFGSCITEPTYSCEDDPQAPCDDVLGAGVVFPKGANASDRDCAFASGERWIDNNEPDLEGAFSCAARVGSEGDRDERQMGALLDSLDGDLRAGQCNSGFLRDDAILVVTMISDEDDVNTFGTPQEWFDAVVEAKNGNAQSIVTLGLLNDTTCGVAATTIQSFFDQFPNNLTGSVCAPDYSPLLGEAIELIESTCNDFMPPG